MVSSWSRPSPCGWLRVEVLRGPTPTFMVKAWLADNPAWRCLYVRGVLKTSVPSGNLDGPFILSIADSNAGEFRSCRRLLNWFSWC
jgi:hypothetical protein